MALVTRVANHMLHRSIEGWLERKGRVREEQAFPTLVAIGIEANSAAQRSAVVVDARTTHDVSGAHWRPS